MDKEAIFWNGYEPLLRILMVGVMAGIGIIFVLRIAGRRTLLRMSAFDLAVKVTIGLAVGFVFTAKQVSLIDVLVIFALLVGLQLVVSWIEKKPEKLSDLITESPTLLFYRGRFLEREMKKHRVCKAEVIKAAGAEKLDDMKKVKAVVLEKNRSLTIIKRTGKGRDR
ncbi:hypothetical protein CLV24_105175 [Pontibacter ummariensis]|uniref:YetF C-terminal domain-containing protein n=1 Tax=Pontibacter ummariensis TaxID=1610492 RepID=A0A239DRW1_9BACT|nr:YetF domain-containing protein [Pontibacter ummariensis]PRY13805.1 hypothetical protein CLV24_105175 [Pontibacter ummariensis]SNS34668.1 hypothetical protein SAMN06296052_10577 [Pontibacter ummariensis]